MLLLPAEETEKYKRKRKIGWRIYREGEPMRYWTLRVCLRV